MKHFKLLLASFAFLGAMNANAQAVGDIVEIDGKNYEITSDNMIYNPSFDYGVDGWFAGNWNDADASNYTLQDAGGYDDGPYLQYSAGGATANTNIRNSWSVSPGETYLFRCYTSGSAPSSNNLQYSFIRTSEDGATEGTTIYQLKWGASTEWTENNCIFTATTDYVVFRSSWTQNSKLDGFLLCSVQLYIDDTAYNASYDAAYNALYNDEEYSNVGGIERTTLEETINTYSNASPEQFEEAIKALDEATATFKAAKADYDAYVNAMNYYLPYPYYGTEEKENAANQLLGATPNSAAEATEIAASYIQALRVCYESHALTEGYDDAKNMTSRIQNPDATNGNNGWTWTGSKNNPRNTESWTDSQGKNDYMYFDGGNWNGTGWTTTMKQTISLPAGYYMLTAKGRASDGVTLTMSVGENSVELPNVNASGNVFDRGWNDGSVTFDTQGEDVTISITATTEGNKQWFSVGDFRLMRIFLYTEMADADDYAALNAAITASEAKKLGFDAGEFAPYNNVEVIQALATAKTINQEEENGKEEVNNLTSILTENWEQNEVELNAVYDGTLAYAPIQATSENVVLPGWVTKSGNTRQTFGGADNDNGGKACLVDADDQVGLFVHPGTYNYGETVGYTMPLKGGVTYLAQAKYCAWANNSNNNFGLTILKDGAKIAEEYYGANKIACTEAGALKNVKLYFTPEEDGDYVLSVNANGNTFMTDFYIMRAVLTDLVLLNASTEVPEEQYAGTVTTDRVLLEGLNTLVLPFETTKEEIGATTVLEYTGTTVEADGLTLNFTEVESLSANVPYAVMMDADAAAPLSFEMKEVTPAEDLTVADDNFTFVGTYVDIPKGNDIVVAGDYVAGAEKFKKAKGGNRVAAYRAYLKKAEEVPAEVKIAFNFDGTIVDGIEAVEILNKLSGNIYNLNGQKMEKAQKGVNIINGKKVLVK